MNHSPQALFNRCALILSGAIMLGSFFLAQGKPTDRSHSSIAVDDVKLQAASPNNSVSVTEQNRTVFAQNPLNELTETPADIKGLMLSAQESAANEQKDGDIAERQYGKKSANAAVGNLLIRNNTDTQKNLDFKALLEAGADLHAADKTKPAVLIFHTHTTEAYELLDRGWYAQGSLTRSKSADRNMIRVGMEIVEQLEKAGYQVIHDKEIHDLKYTGAYAHSRVNVEKYLKQYPSIQIVLDIHRDAIEQENGVRIKPTVEIMGKKAAQMMIITGCQEGKIKNFPEWKYNLRFALQLQKNIESKYPGLMRPLYFCERQYNMDCSRNNLLIEVGSSANTLEEAAYSGRLLGKGLAALLDEAATSA